MFRDVLAEYDPLTGAFTTFYRKAVPLRVSSAVPQGLFDILGDKRVLLYRLDGILYLDVGGKSMPMESLVVELGPRGSTRTLRVLVKGIVAAEVTYEPTPFIEDEDFDFGVLIANVSRDKRRQSEMFSL